MKPFTRRAVLDMVLAGGSGARALAPAPPVRAQPAGSGLLVFSEDSTGTRGSQDVMSSGSMVTIEPQEIDDLLANPGMGWQTFHTFADRDPALQGLPSSTCYFRWYWKDLEPADGQINFELIDRTLEQARRAGQQLAFRVMTAGTGAAQFFSPQWLYAAGCRGYWYSYAQETQVHWTPDHDDPLFLDRHLRLIAALGARYDGHPDVALVDIGSVGLWGEWHFSSTTVQGTGQRVPLPGRASRQRIVDAYLAAFRTTPLVMLIGDAEMLAYATARGTGWRADCLGDLGGFSPTWNHMEHFYKQQLARAGADEAWRHGPVAWESCWDMRTWVQHGWDVRFIFDYALELHGSYLNNKSKPLPEGAQYRQEVERFLRRLGYRFVLRSLRHPVQVTREEPFELSMEVENVGVAPCYRDYTLAVRLAPAGLPPAEAVEAGVVLRTPVEVRAWTPGRHAVRAPLHLPPALAPGRFTLAIGIVGPDNQPKVQLAIAGRDPGGWYPLSTLEIT
mgnify:CR=1 FL=1